MGPNAHLQLPHFPATPLTFRSPTAIPQRYGLGPNAHLRFPHSPTTPLTFHLPTAPPQRYGLDPDGPLFKAISGELSNLRWDLPIDQFQYYYNKGNRKEIVADWEVLKVRAVRTGGW